MTKKEVKKAKKAKEEIEAPVQQEVDPEMDQNN